MLCAALGHGPELLVLDDPTLGLDAVARKAFFEELIGDLADRATTVFLATHDLAGIEGIATRVGILKAGKLVLDEDLETSEVALPANPVRQRHLRRARGVGNGARRFRRGARPGPRVGSGRRRLELRRHLLRALPSEARRRGRRGLAHVARRDLPGGRRRAAGRRGGVGQARRPGRTAMRGFVAVAYREIEQRRNVLAAAIVAAVLPFLAPLLPAVRHDAAAEVRFYTAAFLAFAFAAGLSLLLGTTAIGSDLSQRRLGFYFSRPIGASAIWTGKIAAAWLVVVLATVIVLAPAALADDFALGARDAPGRRSSRRGLRRRGARLPRPRKRHQPVSSVAVRVGGRRPGRLRALGRPDGLDRFSPGRGPGDRASPRARHRRCRGLLRRAPRRGRSAGLDRPARRRARKPRAVRRALGRALPRRGRGFRLRPLAPFAVAERPGLHLGPFHHVGQLDRRGRESSRPPPS